MKEPHLELPTYDDKNVKRLLAWKPKSVMQYRLHTLVSLLIDVGARIDEALGLKWPDVDFDNLLLMLHGKGRKDRKVPMSLELRKRLYIWQRKLKEKKEKDGKVELTGFVFGTQGGTKQGRRNVLRDVKILCRSLGFEPPARTIHAFRHTFATAYLRNGGNVFLLQRALGHSSLEMTRRYSHLQTSDLSAVHERLSLLNA
jgi:integrase/recombinase XerD